MQTNLPVRGQRAIFRRRRDGCGRLISVFRTGTAALSAGWCFALVVFALQEPAWAGGKSGNPSEQFFTNGRIPRLTIEVTATNVAVLQKEVREYVRATVKEDGAIYQDVGIHLKGGAGSFRKLDNRPSLTLNFDKFQQGQRFHGLDKLYLNNSVQDPSYMTEAICGEMFRAAGVPAPRVTHARVELNGRDLGLYVLKEGFDRKFLKRYFKNTSGNLYEGGFIQEINGDVEQRSVVGHPSDRADLKALAAAALEPDLAARMARLTKAVDLERVLSFMAMEIMVWHWDGYCLNRNNYRLYHDPESDKLIFLPSGMDRMFWDSNGPLEPKMQGIVARGLLQIPEARERYFRRVRELSTNVFNPEVLANRVNELQARIRPVLASIDEKAAAEHDKQAERLRILIVQRAASIDRQLRER